MMAATAGPLAALAGHLPAGGDRAAGRARPALRPTAPAASPAPCTCPACCSASSPAASACERAHAAGCSCGACGAAASPSAPCAAFPGVPHGAPLRIAARAAPAGARAPLKAWGVGPCQPAGRGRRVAAAAMRVSHIGAAVLVDSEVAPPSPRVDYSAPKPTAGDDVANVMKLANEAIQALNELQRLQAGGFEMDMHAIDPAGPTGSSSSSSSSSSRRGATSAAAAAGSARGYPMPAAAPRDDGFTPEDRQRLAEARRALPSPVAAARAARVAVPRVRKPAVRRAPAAAASFVDEDVDDLTAAAVDSDDGLGPDSLLSGASLDDDLTALLQLGTGGLTTAADDDGAALLDLEDLEEEEEVELDDDVIAAEIAAAAAARRSAADAVRASVAAAVDLAPRDARRADAQRRSAAAAKGRSLVGPWAGSRRRKAAPRGMDSVKVYLREIGSVALLTAEDEVRLAQLIQDLLELENVAELLTADKGGAAPTAAEWAQAVGLSVPAFQARLAAGRAAKDRMVQANLRLVVSIAKQYLNRGMSFQDLIQEGSVGLVRGAEKFDPKRGYKFSTYAHWWIRQAVTRAIADQSRTIRLPVHLFEIMSRIKKVTKGMGEELGREPRDDEVAERMGMPLEKLHLIYKSAQLPLSLEAKVGDNEKRTLEDTIEDVAMEAPEDTTTRILLKEDLDNVLNTLSPRERDVLRLRYGLDDGRIKTLEEIGNKFQVTRERIRQIEGKALRKLRQPTRTSVLREYLER